MKKSIFIVILVLLLISSVSAIQEKYECSNNKTTNKDIREIKRENVKYANGMGVGNIYSKETPAIGKIEAELIIDAEKLSLDLSAPKKEADLLVGKVEVILTKVQSENVTLKVAGSSKVLEKEVYSKVGNYEVFVTEIYPLLNKTDFIVGHKKIYLTNNGPENYKIKIKNDTFLVQIESASLDNAIIGVRRCENADIIKIKEINESVNGSFTYSDVKTNFSEEKCETGSEKNRTFCNSQGIFENKKSNKVSCREDYECLSDLCYRKKCEKKIFIDKIIDWFKGIFGF